MKKENLMIQTSTKYKLTKTYFAFFFNLQMQSYFILVKSSIFSLS